MGVNILITPKNVTFIKVGFHSGPRGDTLELPEGIALTLLLLAWRI